ncbi:MAG: hypothetical protein IIA59_06210 [Candidatus Marinimicrobia bacterium]|nr:hypothetical protein [Candidatus Neomarinimicrobiota bacterium]
MHFKPTRIKPVWIARLSFLLWLSCGSSPDELIFDNPLDPEGDDYIPPLTTILASPSDTLMITTAQFSWTGSHEDLEFAYRLNDDDFSTWTLDTSATLDYLDEGDYLFQVKSGYPTGIEETTPADASFTVDAVPPKSLLLYPYRIVASVGDTLSVELRAHGITGLTVLDFRLEYDSTVIKPIAASAGPFLAKDGGSLIIIEEFDPYWHVNIGIGQGPEKGVTGTGAIITFQFEVVSAAEDSISLVIESARGPTDSAVEISSIRGTVFRIEAS